MEAETSAPGSCRAELVATLVVVPLLLAVESWRRWGELLDPAALDDTLVGGAALVAVVRLARGVPGAHALWTFVCGGAWFLSILSFWGSIYWRDQGDPSGAPVVLVAGIKLALVLGVSVFAWRAVRRSASAAR